VSVLYIVSEKLISWIILGYCTLFVNEKWTLLRVLSISFCTVLLNRD